MDHFSHDVFKVAPLTAVIFESVQLKWDSFKMTISRIINMPAKREHLAFVTPEKVCPLVMANLPWSDSTSSGREADSCRDRWDDLSVLQWLLIPCTYAHTLLPSPTFSVSSCTCCISVEGWKGKTAEGWMNKIPWNELAAPVNCFGPHRGAVLPFCVEFACFTCACAGLLQLFSPVFWSLETLMALVLFQRCCVSESDFLCSLYFRFCLSIALNFFGTLLFCVKFCLTNFVHLLLLCFSFCLCILWSHASSVWYQPFQTMLCCLKFLFM